MPQPAPVPDDPAAAPSRGGAMGAAIRAHDWSRTPVGDIEQWPQSLKTVVRLMLESRYPMFVWWGAELINFHNDAYSVVLGRRRDGALGRPAAELWHDIWDAVGPQAGHVMREGRSSWNERVLLVMERNGYPEETYFTYSYSPAYDDDGAVGGVFCTCTEETERVVGERRLQTLRALSGASVSARSAAQAAERAAGSLADAALDLPFALIYLLDEGGEAATLVAGSGLAAGAAGAPARIALADADAVWPLGLLRRPGDAALALDDLPERCGDLRAGPWPDTLRSALVLPLAGGGDRLAGYLVAGLSPRRPWDAAYADFVGLVAGQVANAISDARAFEHETRRAETLAELDRAKTLFFSNVSHELRTPLTLMLGPIADLLGAPAPADAAGVAAQRELLALAQRSGQRLQRLVNSLLDFSRIEAGRMRARYEPVDLAALTADLASVFRSAVERAGLELVVDCAPLPQPVYVDRDLWEKIVLNLLSNALKFTFAGRIEVRLRAEAGAAELVVADTGTGVPDDAQPRLFERFFRVDGAAARSVEGSGIGLALVAELARLHGGSVAVDSRVGDGSRFSVRLPFGRDHLPPDEVVEDGAPVAAASGAGAFLDEASDWLRDTHWAGLDPDDNGKDDDGRAPPADTAASGLPRVLIADDNADMRGYLRRLLERDHAVRTVGDGAEALQLAQSWRPDLLLSDVMMPGLDGFALMRALRADPRIASTPVVLLSARAGDEARLEGLAAGADDYLTKPFQARELVSRVAGTLALARTRQEAMRREAALRAETENVLESITEGFVAVDAQWRFSHVNAAAERLLQQPRAQLLGVTLWQAFPDVAGSPFEGPYRRAMAERVALRVDSPYPPLQAWLEVSVYPVAGGGLAFYFRDILQSKQLEQSLRDSEARFRTLADAMPQIVYVTDPDGGVEFVNRQWADYTGQPQGVDLAAAVHPDDLPAMIEQWNAARRSARPYSAEFRLRSAADGSYRWFLTRATPVRGDDGQVLRWYGTSTDIDAHKRNAEGLRRAHEALQESERRKDEFLATLAHELRNPLAPLRNALHILQLTKSAETGERVRAMMQRQIEQLVRLVDDLLEVSRINSGKIELRREPLRLAAVLASAVETSRPLIDAGRHVLQLDIADETMTVDGDAVRLAQVFANLLNNAAKYTDPGGSIHVDARRVGDEAVVTVRDSGVGIEPAMLSRVFELFVQVQGVSARAQGGLGIGLSLVRSLLALHGGRVEARSAGAGSGSEFVVHLPLIATAAAVDPGVDAPPAALPASRRVLVVDDNRDAADSLGLLLRFLGADVQVAHDGPSALAAAEAHQPKVVLLDIGMPGMDGYEVAQRLRATPHGREALLVALTGWGQENDRRRSREHGFDHHLVKPADLDAVQALLDGSAPAPAALAEEDE